MSANSSLRIDHYTLFMIQAAIFDMDEQLGLPDPVVALAEDALTIPSDWPLAESIEPVRPIPDQPPVSAPGSVDKL